MSLFDTRNFLRAVSLSLATAAIVACGGGSGGDGVNNPPPSGGNPPPATPTTGTVAVILRDFPNGEFCSIYADVERIELLGEDGRTTLVEYLDPADDGRFDLLALRVSGQVLDVATDVPIGEYEKIRMTLADLSLVPCDGSGMPDMDTGTWEHPKIPGNGKLDLVPRDTINVIGGATLLIDIDMDMKKSLHLHQTGQGNGKWQFRPVIFVDVVTQIDETRLVRVFGEVRASDNVSAFELCPVGPMGPGTDDGDDMGSDDDSGRCLDVFLRDGSPPERVFGPDGVPVGFPGNVTEGTLLTAIGFLGLYDDDDDEDIDEDDFRLDGVVLHVGPEGGFARLDGSVESELDGEDVFGFSPDSTDVEPVAPIDVKYQGGPILDVADNSEVGPEAILPAAMLEVNGVPVTDLPFNATLILFKDAGMTPPEEVELIGGTITTILLDSEDDNPDGRQITVQTPGDPAPVDNCVKTVDTTEYLEIDENVSPSTTTTITFDDLAEGDSVDVSGSYEEPSAPETSCIISDTIQKYVPAPAT